MASSGTTSTKTRFTGAQLIVHLLERQGITTVAGIPGGTVLPLYDALSQSTQIRHVLARHEQGAGFIAQGMARTQGKPAVCMACSGPGATNLVTAIADARLDSIPLICITGQVPSSMIGTDAFQEVDTYGISIPITKHNYLVRDITELPQVISYAFRIAQSGRPGPVWIDIPKDVQTAEIEIDVLPEPGERAPAPEFSAESVRDAAAMINAAKRPVLYLGGGAINAADEIRQFAEKANLPTTMTLMALGMLPKAHPLSLGMLGMHGARSTNYILQEADLLIVMGARFDDRAIGKTEQFCPNAKIIHVDIDRAELGKIKQPHVAIQGDVADVLAQLIPQTDATDRADWRQMVADLQREFPGAIPTEGDPLSHYGLINAVAACVDDSAIITTDVGQHQMWTAQAYPLNRPRQWLTSGGLGTMGFGLPAAVGAALANPDRKVICFSGDGSLMMNIQEMATAAENQLDVKIILMNNEALGLVHQQQSLFYKQGVFAATYPGMINFMQIAAGFGLHTCDLNAEEDAHAALQAAISRPGPALIHVRIDPEQKVYPMVPPGAANTEMVGE
ncbi:acetolactate synthase large subunit [Enterobacter cloacae]|uniref:Acetolactate synthase n=1 Tax=Enterobacter cloacae subsp. cloacae (strain ATCC 13047 / DSM 30054 / NBRC 13535 / NCTC 10005 / WDCM 00083 / NCDC 279-56) TaxID=716541 RepID=A0A0H3CGC2_ENTCC|nr:acetolactate synthase large subunit [Enterobacter cloacae]ADF59602.1 acetolactate synthase catalytic subunit [Enterobacter cloacae subsp. cloacae ATCC 13047]KGB10406.1 acetolactate synthase, large subunit, biosynthetic type [Enterobacter cloacae]OOC80399.1 acetolactate synthase, large subunit, biosynthetic type [Enterobacter cloacae]QLA62432.1 acetolactate synthase large subunit [Enterobacter cloacae]QWZ90836.1 acetolactate synthase large subunit [Enterobacter cloacae]